MQSRLLAIKIGDDCARESGARVRPRRGLVREVARRIRPGAVPAGAAPAPQPEEAVVPEGVQLGAAHRRDLPEVLAAQHLGRQERPGRR